MKRSIKSRLELLESKVKEVCPSIYISEYNRYVTEVLKSKFEGIKKYFIIWGNQRISTKAIAILPIPDSDYNHILVAPEVNHFAPCGILRDVLTSDIITMFETSIRHPHGVIGSMYETISGVDREMFTRVDELLDSVLHQKFGTLTYMVQIRSEKCIHVYPLTTPEFIDHLEFELRDNVLMRVFTKANKVIEKDITIVNFTGYAYSDYSYMEKWIVRSLLDTV